MFGTLILILRSPTGSSAPVIPEKVCDRHVLRAIADAIRATNQFDGVYRGIITDGAGKPADFAAIAVVYADNFEETSVYDDDDETQYQHNFRFRVTVEARNDDPELREEELDRLYCAIANVINYKSLDSLTIPALTLIRRGNYGKPDHPSQPLELYGETAYFVDAPDLHDDLFD